MKKTKQLLTALALEVRSKGITQQDIADKLGIDRSGVTHLFACKRSPSTEKTLSIMEIIGVKGFVIGDEIKLIT